MKTLKTQGTNVVRDMLPGLKLYKYILSTETSMDLCRGLEKETYKRESLKTKPPR